jgi:hypothetical protein
MDVAVTRVLTTIIADDADGIVCSLFFLAGHSASGFGALAIDRYNRYRCQLN